MVKITNHSEDYDVSMPMIEMLNYLMALWSVFRPISTLSLSANLTACDWAVSESLQTSPVVAKDSLDRG